VPGVKETALIELARITLVSLLATGIAVALMTPFFWLPLYQDAVSSGVDPLGSSLSSIPLVAAAVITAAVACLLVYFAALCKWRARPPIEGIRLWHRYFVKRRPVGAGDPVLTVELVEETIWKGPLRSFDSDPEDSQRWLSLRQPMSRKRKNASTFTRIAATTESVLLPESQIKSIQVSYPSSTPDETLSPPPTKQAGRLRLKAKGLIAVLCAAQVLEVLGVTVVIVALPAIGADLGMPDSQLQLIVSLYAVLYGSLLLFAGRVSDLIDRRTGSGSGLRWGWLVLSCAPSR